MKKTTLLILSCLATSLTLAQPKDTLTGMERALKMITETAKDICSNPSMQGSNSGLELSIGAKVELNGLLRRLATVGVQSAAKYQSNEWNGLLQRDLLTALRDTNNCRLSVFHSLRDRVLDQSVPMSSESRASGRGASSEGVHGNTQCYANADENGAASGCRKGSN
jgi:hypothetical protein